MENQQQATATETCRAGCGFYGSATTEGLCSKCYKDTVNRKQDAVRITSQPIPISSSPSQENSRNVAIVTERLREVITACQTESNMQSGINQKAMEAKLESAVNAKVDVSSGMMPSSSINNKSSGTVSPQCAPLEMMSPNEQDPDLPLPKKTVNRCDMCKKKVGLTGFTCRCGGMYCSSHRYDAIHSCTFDYRTTEREQIAKNNPTVGFNKIEKI